MNYLEKLWQSFGQHFEKLLEVIPKFIFAVLLLFVGWLAARLIAFIIRKSLKTLRFDAGLERINVSNQLRKLNITKTPSELLATFCFWVILLLVLVGFAEAFELEILSDKIGQLIDYLPNIIISLFILILGLYIASRLRKGVETTFLSYGIKAGKMVGNMVFYILLIVICLTVLEQLQFNIDLLTTNVMILVAGIALAFAIAYGLSAKEILPNMISSYYGKNQFKVGQKIRIKKAEGTIVEMTKMSVVIQNEEGRLVIPAKKLITQEVQIIENL